MASDRRALRRDVTAGWWVGVPPDSSRESTTAPGTSDTPSTTSLSGPRKDVLRISPSVTTSSPARSCSAMTSSTARSSMRLNSPALSLASSRAPRASLRYPGRSMLPTVSARIVSMEGLPLALTVPA
jgi:hypothetical protein